MILSAEGLLAASNTDTHLPAPVTEVDVLPPAGRGQSAQERGASEPDPGECKAAVRCGAYLFAHVLEASPFGRAETASRAASGRPSGAAGEGCFHAPASALCAVSPGADSHADLQVGELSWAPWQVINGKSFKVTYRHLPLKNRGLSLGFAGGGCRHGSWAHLLRWLSRRRDSDCVRALRVLGLWEAVRGFPLFLGATTSWGNTYHSLGGLWGHVGSLRKSCRVHGCEKVKGSQSSSFKLERGRVREEGRRLGPQHWTGPWPVGETAKHRICLPDRPACGGGGEGKRFGDRTSTKPECSGPGSVSHRPPAGRGQRQENGTFSSTKNTQPGTRAFSSGVCCQGGSSRLRPSLAVHPKPTGVR